MDDGDGARRGAVAGVGEHACDRGAPVQRTEALRDASESVSPFPGCAQELHAQLAALDAAERGKHGGAGVESRAGDGKGGDGKGGDGKGGDGKGGDGKGGDGKGGDGKGGDGKGDGKGDGRGGDGKGEP